MSNPRPRISAFGDAALLVAYPEHIDPSINDLAHALAERLRAARGAGAAWRAPVPSYASVLAPFDQSQISLEQAQAALHVLVEEAEASPAGIAPTPLLEIPVRYGGDDGPDLDEVARRTGLSRARVIELHTAPTYRAYLLGFAPGFAYLGSLPEELRIPRRSTPRQRVPAGSVAIAGEQTAVYPLPTPGGWHLLGRTDLRLWDVERESPALIQPRQVVRFVAVDG